MAKRKKPKTETPSGKDPLALGLLAIAALLIGLAVLQWVELLSVLEGGTTFCSIGDTLNCEAVWNSHFAKVIHARTGVPVAGWGIVYGVAALMAAWRRKNRRNDRAAVFSCRLVGAVGAATSIVLLVVSWQLGVFCLTCIGTYTLVLLYTGLAFRLPVKKQRKSEPVSRVIGVPIASVVVAYLVLLIPGRSTPVEPKSHIPAAPPAPKEMTREEIAKKALMPMDEVGRYLAQLPPEAQQAVSNSVAEMRRSPAVDRSDYPVRHISGNPKAPVRFVDFSDIRCGHCRRLDEVMQELARSVPGRFSLESRFFPLDATCNPEVPKEITDDTGVRCLAPRVLICLEDQPGYEPARHEMFRQQTSLTKELVYSIAVGKGGVSRPDLERCVASEATSEKLKRDIAFAAQYDIHGTPLVLVNGKQGSPVPPFLFSMVLADGDPRHPAFDALPEPTLQPHGH